jgi:hypothetical protein
MKELPLGSSGSEKVATPKSSFTKAVVFQLLKSAEVNLRHAVTVTTCSLLKFIQVSLNKVKVKIQGSNNTRVTIILRSDSLSE